MSIWVVLENRVSQETRAQEESRGENFQPTTGERVENDKDTAGRGVSGVLAMREELQLRFLFHCMNSSDFFNFGTYSLQGIRSEIEEI